MKEKYNELMNKAAIYGIRFLWKVADAETKKAILKELTPKKIRKSKKDKPTVYWVDEPGMVKNERSA